MAITWTMILEAGGPTHAAPDSTPREHRLKTPLIPYVFNIDWQVRIKQQATADGEPQEDEGYEALAAGEELAAARDETRAVRASARVRAWRD
ncbi:uncharacterized protein LOC62_04G006431 [Vanrija pseudolonga]|uniref:Uncharacterized protein n=1 Tax=Vanrija pseudolonga TaxID=143232 RepID=A0AAF0YEC3_9TREE|nr:hypothetical protein LOC62_04G006431 [Vanrija pseudolonga]